MLVFDFLPAYPDSSGVSAPIGESGYEGAEECVAKVGQIAEMPIERQKRDVSFQSSQFSVALPRGSVRT